MAEKQAGITALVTAYARAYHLTHDSPKIFDDFLADQFYTPEEHTFFDQNLAGMLQLIDPAFATTQPDVATALARVMQLHHGPVTLSRSRYAEDCLEESIRRGTEQYVILGAGFDTFAFRRPDLSPSVQIYEVDHPATQALKRERIASAGWQIPSNLNFVPIDFTKESLADALRGSTYVSDKPGFFSWLGVTYYLTRDVVFETLKVLSSAACAGSEIVFDYMDADAFAPEKAGARIQTMQRIATMVGEPMKSGFAPQSLEDDLSVLGLKLQENLSPAEIDAHYFQGRKDQYRAFEHVHFARAVVV
jgi:methyltransferase (TIGR00027 family)